MGKTYDAIDEQLASFIQAQHVFFVATAPSGADGHVNLSPKGLDSLRIVDPRTVAYLDLTGSGVETIAHVRDNRRITLLFCAFEGPPKIVRLYGHGAVIQADHPSFGDLVARFPRRTGTRAVIQVAIDRVADSCGYGVPRYRYEGDRSQLLDWAERKGREGIAAYQREKNTRSIDGMPARVNIHAKSTNHSVIKSTNSHGFFTTLHIDRDVDVVPDDESAAVERLAPRDAEVLAIDAGRGDAAHLDVAHRIFERLWRALNGEHDLLGHAVDGEVARGLVGVVADLLDLLRRERDGRVLGDVEEVGPAQILVAFRLARVDGRRVDRGLHGRLGDVALVQMYRPGHFPRAVRARWRSPVRFTANCALVWAESISQVEATVRAGTAQATTATVKRNRRDMRSPPLCQWKVLFDVSIRPILTGLRETCAPELTRKWVPAVGGV
jgi:hypothetical protein